MASTKQEPCRCVSAQRLRAGMWHAGFAVTEVAMDPNRMLVVYYATIASTSSSLAPTRAAAGASTISPPSTTAPRPSSGR
jgi:hypothetical protein